MKAKGSAFFQYRTVFQRTAQLYISALAASARLATRGVLKVPGATVVNRFKRSILPVLLDGSGD